MKLAQASFPEDAAKRIVIVSDGNENLGDAIEQAQALAGSGVGIDVVPIRYQSRAARWSSSGWRMPGDIRTRPALRPEGRRHQHERADGGPLGRGPRPAGRLAVGRRPVGRAQRRGGRRFRRASRCSRSGSRSTSRPSTSTTSASSPTRLEDDAMPQNNRATTFTHVRGKGQVLLIEDQDSRGEFDLLVQRLREQNLEVTVQPTDRLFAGLAELQPFDTVLLGNVPRERLQRRPDRDARAQHAANGRRAW